LHLVEKYDPKVCGLRQESSKRHCYSWHYGTAQRAKAVVRRGGGGLGGGHS